MNASAEPLLLPRPRRITVTGGPVSVTPVAPTIDPHCGLPPQGYRLRIEPAKISLIASDAAGAFYGQMTLRQLQRHAGLTLPACEIEDWPDFPSRGVMLDISRDKVPTMATLFALVDQLAEWKINHLELYTEHTFAYRNHRPVWEHASPLTAEEIRSLDAYCRERFVELVPNQNSFGHMERWLKHPAYQALASGEHRTCLNPQNPASVALLAELFAELLPNFTSRKFNVGCDETYGIGGRVYLEFLLKIYELTKRHGRTMHFWGDIIVHHPELVPELPQDIVVLEWGYDIGHPFDEHGALFAKTGIPFYVCPGTSSWNSIVGRTHNALGNLTSAAVNGLKHGAIGFLNTDWGDHGHWQPLPVSYLGFAAGAALSWCATRNQDLDYRVALSAHVFQDAAGVLGPVAYDLGNAYLQADCPLGNANVFFQLLQQPPTADFFSKVAPAKMQATREYIAAVMQPLDRARSARPDAALLQAEFRLAAWMADHACRRALKENPATLAADLREIIAEYQRVWLARNRPGGLPDSVRRLEYRLEDYR